jgi:hypothetical protein
MRRMFPWVVLFVLACRGRHADSPRDGRAERASPSADADGRPLHKGAQRRDPDEIPTDKPATVLLIVMDTVRADHLSLCGYGRPTSPFLEHVRDAFGASWSCDAYSPATWTMPSHTSYFTGLRVDEHGHDRLGGSLRPDLPPMLAETFAERGYETALVAANPALGKSGLQKGFAHVRIAKDMTELRQATLADALRETLRGIDASKPLFLAVNLIDAHDPYPKVPTGVGWLAAQDAVALSVNDPERDSPYHQFLKGEMGKEKAEKYLKMVTDGYDWGVHQEDAAARDVFDVLRASGRLPGPLRVVITADHGEFLGEHGLLRHAAYVYEPVVKVPFLYFDNLVAEPLALPKPMSALHTYRLLLDGTLDPRHTVPTSASRVMDERPIKPGADMLAQWLPDGEKVLWADGASWTVDLRSDPSESRRTERLPDAAWSEAIAHYTQHLRESAARPLDAGAVESLRALGYLEDGGSP